MAQAGNSTYLMESFNKLVHDLEEPLGVSAPLSLTPSSHLPDTSSPALCSLPSSQACLMLPTVVLHPTSMHALRNGHTMSIQHLQVPYSAAAQAHLDSG